jgi:hypothetical protein
MVAGSILPVCIHNNQLYFLFGKENKKEKDAPGWADFGGGCEPRETPYQTALREGYEETSGFLQPKDLVKHVFELSCSVTRRFKSVKHCMQILVNGSYAAVTVSLSAQFFPTEIALNGRYLMGIKTASLEFTMARLLQKEGQLGIKKSTNYWSAWQLSKATMWFLGKQMKRKLSIGAWG